MLTDERIKRFKQYKDNVDLRYETMLYGWLEECIAEIELKRQAQSQSTLSEMMNETTKNDRIGFVEFSHSMGEWYCQLRGWQGKSLHHPTRNWGNGYESLENALAAAMEEIELENLDG